jgi:hypothetical protein
MRQQMARSFHHFGAFVRFRVVAATGSLSGRNPLPDLVTATLTGTPAPR